MGQMLRGEQHGEPRARVAVKGKPFQPRPEEPSAENEAPIFGKKSLLTQVSKVDWQSEKLTSEQGRFLNRTFTEFAQFLAPQLTPLVQLRAMVDLKYVHQRPFKEFLDDFSTCAPLVVFSFDEKNKGVLGFDPSIAYVVLDYLMGGKGEIIEEIREFTEIESTLFQNQILSRVLSAFTEAWKEIVSVNTRLEALEFSPNNLTLFPYRETLLCARFALRVGIMSGHFEMALPLKYVRQALPRNPDQFTPQSEVRKEAPHAIPMVSKKIETMIVDVTVELGRTEIYFQDLLGLEEGDMIRLQTARGEPLRVRVAGKTKFLGKPGASDKKMAVRISEVVQEGDETLDD